MPSKLEAFENLVESYSKHPDQGLKQIKKKLQKDPSNTTFLLAQASFLVDLARPQEALDCCDGIKSSPKVPLEPGIIIALEELVRRCQEELGTFTGAAGPRLSGFWKDALDNCPKQWLKDTRSEMLVTAVKNGYWDLAQQLYARLQREFPQNAKFHFAWIAFCQIQADKLPEGDKMISSMKMLASRSLKTATESTIARKETPKKISSSAELRLLCETYVRQGLFVDVLDVLDQPDIGITSTVGKYDVEFISLKMDMLRKLERWADLKEYCVMGLDRLCKFYEEAGSTTVEIPNQLAWANAWQPWLTALTSSAKVSANEPPKDVEQLIQRYSALNPSHRNASNALLHYAVLFEPASKVKLFETFFKIHSSKLACFDDLRQVVEKLDDAEIPTFLDGIASTIGDQPASSEAVTSLMKWTIASINNLRLRYLLRISRAGVNEVKDIIAFVVDCLKVYEPLAEVEDGPADEAATLAIIALMKLGSIPSASALLQAACLAQLLRDNSQHHYTATLLHVLVCRLLGLGSMAIAAFRDLSLREVQYDSLGHLLFTRVSCLHPHAVSLRSVKAIEERHKDPAAAIKFALQWPEKASNAVLNTLGKDVVENVFFDKFFEFTAMLERVERSYNLLQGQIEMQRMGRLTGSATMLPLPRTCYFDHADNRDFKIIPDYEHSTSKPFADIALGQPTPRSYWGARWQLNEVIWSLLTLRPAALTESQDRVLSKLLGHLEEHSDVASKELSSGEREVTKHWDILLAVTIWLTLGPKHARASKDVKKDVTSLIESLDAAKLALSAKELSIGDAADVQFTSTTLFESHYLNLELAKACDSFVNAATTLTKQKTHHASGKISADILGKLKTASKGLVEAVQKSAKTLKESLRKDGKAKVLKAVKEGPVGEMLEKLAGGEQLRRYVDEIMESAEEGLDGVLKVKL